MGLKEGEDQGKRQGTKEGRNTEGGPHPGSRTKKGSQGGESGQLCQCTERSGTTRAENDK